MLDLQVYGHLPSGITLSSIAAIRLSDQARAIRLLSLGRGELTQGKSTLDVQVAYI